jgi:membrane fusion protein (multidrug efflux system)
MSGNLKKGSQIRFYLLLFVFIVIVFGGIYGLKWHKDKQAAQLAASTPPSYQTISAVLSKKMTWYNHVGSVATMTSVQGVDVSAQVSGKIMKLEFKSGQMIKKGEEMLQLEDFAEIQQLNNYLATMKIDKVTMDRQYQVYKAGLISHEEYDEAKAAYEAALANVQMEQANINYKHVRAPFTGILGINNLNVGEYLSAGTTIANLQTIQPIYADFSLPEQYFNTTEKGQQVGLSVLSMPNKVFLGTVYAKSSAVDAETRNFTVRAIFENEEALLKPGMSANADLRIGHEEQVILIPRTAVVYSLYGNQIYTLVPDQEDKTGKLYKIKAIPADLGDVVGTDVIVKSGLDAGVSVVASGQLKVFNDAVVLVDDSVKLTPLLKSELKGP